MWKLQGAPAGAPDLELVPKPPFGRAPLGAALGALPNRAYIYGTHVSSRVLPGAWLGEEYKTEASIHYKKDNTLHPFNYASYIFKLNNLKLIAILCIFLESPQVARLVSPQ